MKSKRTLVFLVFLIISVFIISCGDDDDDDNSPGNEQDDDDTADDDAASDDDDNDDSSDDDDDDNDDADDDTVPQNPLLRGPYQVGNRTYEFTDPARHDPATNSNRKLVTEVWYPAVDSAADMPRDVISNFLGNWADDVFEMLEDEGASPEEIENFEQETGAARDAPILADHGPYPIVLFSHGNAGVRFQNFTMCEYLASHGFIVIAPDHTGNSLASPFEDQLVLFDEKWVFFSYWFRKGDLSFLIDTFLELNEDDPDDFFTGMIDPTAIGAMGHSFGGTAAVEATKDDQRIRACIDMASFMFPWFIDDFSSSLMWMIGLEDNTMGDVTFLMRLDYSISPPPKFKLEFPDGGHYTFSDVCILLPSVFGDGDGCGEGQRRWGGETFTYIEHEKAQGIIDAYATAFFGFNLRDEQHMEVFLTENHFPEDIRFDCEFEEPAIN